MLFEKISFIGHSLGGLIIRAALPELSSIKDRLHIYVSFGTAHLGYLFTDSSLIKTGMWVLKSWRKAVSLEQMSFTDEKNIEESFLYKMSVSEGLNWFRRVFLVSSHQDRYAPFESTRIQLTEKSLNESKEGNAHRNMAYNLLSKLSPASIVRVDVNFLISEK